MKNRILLYSAVAIVMAAMATASCQDELSDIGNSLTPTETTINVDSVSYDLLGATIPAPMFESKSNFTLIGAVSVPEYGDLACSYVTQFLPTESLNVPDSITSANVDSVKMILSVPKAYITGDSLISQQLKVYSLTKDLPADIPSSFNPEGYYDPASTLGIKSYNLSGETYKDTTYTASSLVSIKVPLPLQMGVDVFKAYETTPEIFTWPQQFAKLWPGVYVESSFGRGAIAPVANTCIYAYFPKTVASSVTDSEGNVSTAYKQVADSVCLFTTAPEVISSVNIDYRPSPAIQALVDEGNSIITTPGGYAVNITFPAKQVLEQYWDQSYDLGVINNMTFSIPAKEIANKYGIGVPPSLLMVKTSELENFFSEGKVPDNVTSFTGEYSASKGVYSFGSMRKYIVEMRAKGEGNITDDDLAFTLVPVEVTTESVTNPYTNEVTIYVTGVLPYILKPTMVQLDTRNANITFTYSNQLLN